MKRLIIEGATILDVFTGRLEQAHVAIEGERIIHVGRDLPPWMTDGAEVMDATGLYCLPGYIDGHIHIESSLLTPDRFAQAVVPRGTTTVVADPHEIANCLGIPGVHFMIDCGTKAPLDLFLTAPSCVPAAPGLETSGATLGTEEVKELLELEEVLGLGEVMNYPGVISGDQELMAKIRAAHHLGKVVDGHAPGLSGPALSAYVAAGIDSDHECISLEEARERLSAGMYLFIREGSTAKNMAALLPAAEGPASSRCCLVTDDVHPDDLLKSGHLDNLLRLAVGRGLSPQEAVRMVTINPAVRFGLKDRGAVSPGRLADLVLVEDLAGFQAAAVIKSGKKVAEHGRALFDWTGPSLPGGTGPLPVDISPADLETLVQGPKVRAIRLVDGQIITKAVAVDTPSDRGRLTADPDRDLALLAVIERHRGTGSIGKALVQGLGLRQGAIASTVAHDSHNLIVAGMDMESIYSAASALIASGGGLAAALGHRVEILPLPVAGIMSPEPVEKVVQDLTRVLKMAEELGCKPSNPFMALSFLALPVIPELRLTDQGLVDAKTFTHTPLFV